MVPRPFFFFFFFFFFSTNLAKISFKKNGSLGSESGSINVENFWMIVFNVSKCLKIRGGAWSDYFYGKNCKKLDLGVIES